MIGFARWSMIDRIPAGVDKEQATPLRRPFLLFETNFNGDHDAYFEAFAFVVPKPMNRMGGDGIYTTCRRWNAPASGSG